MPSINLSGKNIDYEVRESEKASKPRIDIDINRVRTVIPKNSNIKPKELLKKKRGWVLKKKEKFDSYREKIPNREFKEGSEFPFLGKERTIRLSSKKRAAIEEGNILIPEEKVKKNSIKEVIENIYREKARDLIKERVEEYTNQLDKDYNKVYIRNQKTKWGSCSSKSNLSFNWRLLMAPEYVLDYVIAHECTHLEERNHSKNFWKKLEDLVPEYKKAINWLKENSPKLVFSPEVPN